MSKPGYGDAIRQADIAAVLDGLHWEVAGTLPLGIAMPASDIDIVCAAFDPGEFARRLWCGFAHCEDFCLRQWAGPPHAIIASFRHAGWPFEVFGMACPLEAQAGWRHFRVEQRLLALGGEAFRARVMAARRGGLKTEPAFAAVLGLAGDPYEALLALAGESDAALAARIAACAGRASVAG